MTEPYWASLDGDLLAAAMLEKVRIFTQRFIGSRDLEKLEAAARAYYGTDEEGDFSWRIERKGAKKQIRALKANRFRTAIQMKLAIVTGTPAGFIPVPVNTDEKSIQQSLIAKGVLDYYFDEGGVNSLCDLATEEAEVLQSAWVDVDWSRAKGDTVQMAPGVTRVPRMDATGQAVSAPMERKSGDVDVQVYLPTDVICEYESRRQAKDWIILRSWHNRYDIAAMMEIDAQGLPPEEQEQALQRADLVRGLSSASNTDDEQLIRALRLQLGQVQPIDEVPVLDLRHLPCPALPRGRRARLVGTSILLEAGDLPFEDLGAYEIRAGRRFGTTRAYSGAHDVLGLNRAHDTLTSIPYSNQAALGLNVIVSPAQSDLRLNKLREGLVALETKTPQFEPKVLQLCRTPPETFPFRKEVGMEIGQGIGLTPQSQGLETRESSGAARALEDTQTQRNVSHLGKAYQRLRQDVANAIIRRLKRFGARMPRKLPMLVGKSKVPKLMEFTPETDLEGIDRVRVETIGPLAGSIAMRIEAAKDMLQMDAVDGRPVLNPDQYITLITTGKYEPMTEAPLQEMQTVRAENERMAAGEMLDVPPGLDPKTGQPTPPRVTAVFTDPPLLHIKEHATVLGTLEARSNPAVVQATTAHIQAHMPFLLQWMSGDPTMVAIHGVPPPLPLPPGLPASGQGAPNGGGGAPTGVSDKQPNLPNLPTNPQTGESYSPTGAANGR